MAVTRQERVSYEIHLVLTATPWRPIEIENEEASVILFLARNPNTWYHFVNASSDMREAFHSPVSVHVRLQPSGIITLHDHDAVRLHVSQARGKRKILRCVTAARLACK